MLFILKTNKLLTQYIKFLFLKKLPPESVTLSGGINKYFN